MRYLNEFWLQIYISSFSWNDRLLLCNNPPLRKTTSVTIISSFFFPFIPGWISTSNPRWPWQTFDRLNTGYATQRVRRRRRYVSLIKNIATIESPINLIMNVLSLQFFRAQSYHVQLPQNFTCTDCTIRLLRKAEEWGSSYRFWSCADIDVSSIGITLKYFYRSK